MARTVIGTFQSQQQAEEAIRALRQNGFDENEISLVARQSGEEGSGQQSGQDDPGMGMSTDSVSDGVGWGAGLGAGAGMLATAGALAVPGIGPILAAGPLSATLSGAVTGGIAGGLLDWGIPEDRGQHFEGRVREGKILCVVRSEEQKVDEVANIMRQHGARDVETHQATA